MFGIIPREETFYIPGLNPINIIGHSLSAKRTGYLLMPYNIVFDAGYCFTKPCNLTLVSHGHFDHIAAIYQILKDSKSRKVMLPKSIESNMTDLLNSSFRLDSGTSKKFNWIPITDSSYNININGKEILITTYQLDHRVESIGFGVIEIQKKIKSEYNHLSNKMLCELIKKKVDVKYDVQIPIILFISDTSSKILNKLPFDSYKIVIIECTFLLETDYKDSHIKKHIHWLDLENYIKVNSQTKFILGHFSTRYKIDFLKEKEIKLKEIYPNIIFWI